MKTQGGKMIETLACRACGIQCMVDAGICPECGTAVVHHTQKSLSAAKTPAGEGIDTHDLAGTAAQAAAWILSGNWADALKDGADISSLTGDVDDVIAVLSAWRNAVTHAVTGKEVPA